MLPIKGHKYLCIDNSTNDGWINLDRVGGRIRSYVLVGK